MATATRAAYLEFDSLMAVPGAQRPVSFGAPSVARTGTSGAVRGQSPLGSRSEFGVARTSMSDCHMPITKATYPRTKKASRTGVRAFRRSRINSPATSQGSHHAPATVSAPSNSHGVKNNPKGRWHGCLNHSSSR